jgi:hypothetical protein
MEIIQKIFVSLFSTVQRKLNIILKEKLHQISLHYQTRSYQKFYFFNYNRIKNFFFDDLEPLRGSSNKKKRCIQLVRVKKDQIYPRIH